MVSVIIPVYNAGQFLADCLDSVVGQSLTDIEVIVVDDGSTDGSAAIAADCARRDSRVKLLTQPNRGVSAARNAGIDISRGEYIAFVDADDLLHPRALELLTATARSAGADACIGTFKSAKSPGGWPGNVDTGAIAPKVMTYTEAMHQALYQKLILNSPCGMVAARRLFDGVRFAEGIRYEDLDAFYRIYESAAKLAWIDCPLYFYRQVPSSFIHRWHPSRLDALDVTDRMVDYMRLRHPQLVAAALERRFSAHFNTLLRLYKYRVDNPTAIARCLDIIRQNRRAELSDPNVRLKNKAGALLSYLGTPALRLLALLPWR